MLLLGDFLDTHVRFIAGFIERIKYTACEDAKCHDKRQQRVDVNTQWHKENLDADQHKNDCERHLQIAEPVHCRSKCEIKRAQTQHRKDIRGVDDERVLSDGEDGGNRVDGKDQIDSFHHNESDCQRREPGDHLAGLRMRLLNREMPTMQFAGDIKSPTQKLEYGVLFDVGRLVLMPEHFEAGEDKESAKEKENPVKLVHERSTKSDQDRSKGDNAQNTPKQNAMLVKTGMARKPKIVAITNMLSIARLCSIK